MRDTILRRVQVPVFPEFFSLVTAGEVPLRVMLRSGGGGPVTCALTVQDIVSASSNAIFDVAGTQIIVLAPKQTLYVNVRAAANTINSAASEALPLARK